jgi:hypothetical protein
MKIYNYDPTTGELLNSEEAFESPLEPGVYLIPAHATESPPLPEVPSGKRQVFKNGAWQLVDKNETQLELAQDSTEEEIIAYNKSVAKKLLQDTDWTQTLDVQRVLKNSKEFTEYRETIREIFLYPTVSINLPAQPVAQWII